MAELLLLRAVVGVPLAPGAIAPAPEEGEPRVAGGDIVFLVVAALVVAGLTWLGAWIARRLRRSAS